MWRNTKCMVRDGSYHTLSAEILATTVPEVYLLHLYNVLEGREIGFYKPSHIRYCRSSQ